MQVASLAWPQPPQQKVSALPRTRPWKRIFVLNVPFLWVFPSAQASPTWSKHSGCTKGWQQGSRSWRNFSMHLVLRCFLLALFLRRLGLGSQRLTARIEHESGWAMHRCRSLLLLDHNRLNKKYQRCQELGLEKDICSECAFSLGFSFCTGFAYMVKT